MSIKWESKILLIKLESTYGTDPTPTGAANGILATEVVLSPMEGQDLSRALETPYLGAQPTIPVEMHAKLRFKVELAPSGTAGTAPAWGPLLRGCAMAETIVSNTSVTYNPVTDDHESLACYFWIGATQYRIFGMRGNCRINVTASGIPYLEFEFTGLFSAPAEVVRVTPTLTAFAKPQEASKANTTFEINSTPFVMRNFMLDLGNDVQTRFLVGAEEIPIPDKMESITTTIEAVPLTTFDPYAAALAQTTYPIELVHGKTAGAIATINVPTAQVQRLQGLENAQKIVEWPLRFVPLPGSGNDQFTLVLT